MSRWIAIILFLIAFPVNAATSSTYYIDYSGGSDANDGLFTTRAWKHAPAMAAFSGSYSYVANDRFIFKGGVTWGGVGVTNISFYISSPNLYFGVQTNWYTGTEWSRPVFDANSQVLQNLRFVSCFANSVTLDGLEFREYYWTGSHSPGNVAFVNISTSTNILITNCVFTSWSHGSYATGTRDDLICVLGNSANPYNAGSLITGCLFDGSPSGTDSGMAAYNFPKVRNSTVCNMSNGFLTHYAIPPDWTEMSGNHVYNINWSFSGAHENALETLGFGGISKVFNNIVHDCVGETFITNGGGEEYYYNNIAWNVRQPVSMDPYNTVGGSFYIYNNTIVMTNSSAGIRIGARPVGRWSTGVVRNNHIITDGVGTGIWVERAPTVSYTESNNLKQTIADAATEGYELATQFAANGSTVDAGYNTSPTVVDDILGGARPYNAVYDIGAYEYGATTPPTPPIPPDPPLLTWPMEAEDMLIDSPFVDGGTYVSQAIQTTNPTNGGLVRAYFDIGTNGTYRLFGNVEAETTASDSVFVNIDAEPETPTHIWDVQSLTTNFEQRYVSWRGSGAYDSPQFGTNTWYLESGQHLLYIRGREANMGLDWLMLEYVSESTNNGVRLTIDTLSTNESAGTITFTVERVGTTASGASVDYATKTFSAYPHKHYYPVQGTLTFGVGETSKTFDVRIIDNAVVDDDLSFDVRLLNPIDTTLLDPSVCRVTVENTDVIYSTWSNWTTP